ncbi:MAG: FHA domain-containing protein [Nannocystaceae bacterium]|nr:FHA domain-containing protein [Myxococcales bacterium]
MSEPSGIFLRIHRGDDHIGDVALEGDRLTIGRSRKVDITLESNGVSRRHAELQRDHTGQWWIRDLYSQNGTSVNGEQVMEHQLSIGDRIEIDEFSLLYRM